ncbi:hypothetical protein [Natronorubrum aibiense]|uniref:Uncharacterized protein n=1 Tax=Natronorubrum aibiense TaxID=348826 RepID=A0A5P9P9D1_9EURY|nr:hypothetical protein [Natronorubrum aibiense]QFU84718.1 hypothetical protein GCU68_19560 [Natronorubrum aibiense]
MRSNSLPSRRQLVGTVGTLVLGTLAGCGNRSDSTDEGDSAAGSPDDSNVELDLREANVVDVSFERDNSQYMFDVTLRHDDEGEDGFANWWQIERLDGTQLGRRELAHAHTQQPFTRSETIDVPDDVTCVVIRGHDQTHEYGGQLMIVNLASSEIRTVDQGSDREAVDESECP